MKICALFVKTCAVTDPGVFAYAGDLAWAWGEFAAETGVPAPADWLRLLKIEHGVEAGEPDRGRTWRGWRLRGIALNPEYAARFSAYRLDRLGVPALPAP